MSGAPFKEHSKDEAKLIFLDPNVCVFRYRFLIVNGPIFQCWALSNAGGMTLFIYLLPFFLKDFVLFRCT